MKNTALLLLVIAMPLLIFGYAGCFSDWGHTNYDEMNGMYPFFALIASGCLLFFSLILFVFHALKK